MLRSVKRSLSVRLPVLFVTSLVVIMGAMIPYVYMRFHSRMIEEYTRMAQGVTQLMVNAVDGDRIDEYLEKGTSLDEYNDLVGYLYTLRDNYPDILYLYVYRFEEDGGHVVIDLDADWWADGEGYEVNYLWGLDEIEEPFKSHLAEVMAGEQITGYSEHTKSDGYLFTYTRPILTSDGEYAATACVDFSMDQLSSKDMAFTLQLSLIVVGIGAVVLALDIFIAHRSITEPINELSRCAEGFAYETERDRKANIELLDALDIRTGDEIEDVYHVLKSVTHDSFDATSRLSQALADIRDRDNMITAMAADYRSIYYADLDKDSCICYRASDKFKDLMWAGKDFGYLQGFTDYALHCVVEEDREAFLRFIDPENVRAALADEDMISHLYLSVIEGNEQYEMLRIAGVKSVGEDGDERIHVIGAGFADVDRETRETIERNKALAEALTRAEEANAAKTTFLSSMSHEIRTPMNAIIGLNTVILRNQDISADTRRDLEKIESSARHLLSLINDILDMSRIESGRMQLKSEEFSLTETIEQISTIIGGQCKDKGLVFASRADGVRDEYFIGDDLRLRQVIINILGNSVKFTESPGTITFTVEQLLGASDGCRLRFTMEDTGIGMDPSFVPRLFDPFVQEDATSTNHYGGSGLGMALTKNMVDLMGGTIAVESEKGRGTTFTVEVPLERAAHVTPATGQKAPPVSLDTVAGAHVLVVEDQETNAEILCDLLEMEGVTSEWARDGQVAVDMYGKAEPGHFDAILMDMRMPVMDGLTATREIRRMETGGTHRVPVVALTANAFEEDMKKCLEAGMDAHLAKPVDIDQVMELLARLLANDNRDET